MDKALEFVAAQLRAVEAEVEEKAGERFRIKLSGCRFARHEYLRGHVVVTVGSRRLLAVSLRGLPDAICTISGTSIQKTEV